MEIIHLILGKSNPQRMNGVNKVVNELATRQIRAGEKVEVWGITANPVHDYPERVYTTRLFKAQQNPFALSSQLKHMVLRKKGEAIFHFHGGFIPAMYSAAMWLKKHDIHFVFTPHGSYNTIAMQKSGFSKKIYFNLFERHVLKAAKTIHSLGKSEVNGLQTVFANDKSVQIPYGFELPEHERRAKNNTEFIVGYCGRLDMYTKGLKELLEGFNVFRYKAPGAKLWIIGDGPEKEKLIRIAVSLGLIDAVIFHGSKFGQEKDELLNQCSVFASPSRNEGLPTAVLEAASMGIPCLVTEATNTGDYIRAYDAGVVIANTCACEIAKGLDELYDRMNTKGQTNILSDNARKMISGAFDWSNIVNKFHQLYQ